MFRLDTLIHGKLRTSIGDEFTDKSSGENIEFKQLQVEMQDAKGRLAIENVSVPKKFWPEDQAKLIASLMDQQVILPVSVTGQKSGSLKLTLIDLPKSEKMSRPAS